MYGLKVTSTEKQFIREWVNVKNINYGVRLYTELFLLSSLPYFPTFCWSEIPTFRYMFRVLYC